MFDKIKVGIHLCLDLFCPRDLIDGTSHPALAFPSLTSRMEIRSSWFPDPCRAIVHSYPLAFRALLIESESEATLARSSRQEMSGCECKPDRAQPLRKCGKNHGIKETSHHCGCRTRSELFLAGLQLGVEATDVVMVFTNHDGIQPLLKGKLKIGADASATAGPVGRKAEAGTDILLKSAIYSYSRSKGLFAGIALDGAVIQLDDDANKSVYGKKTVAADISKGRVGGAFIAVVQPSLRALQKYAPAEVPQTTRKQ